MSKIKLTPENYKKDEASNPASIQTALGESIEIESSASTFQHLIIDGLVVDVETDDAAVLMLARSLQLQNGDDINKINVVMVQTGLQRNERLVPLVHKILPGINVQQYNAVLPAYITSIPDTAPKGWREKDAGDVEWPSHIIAPVRMPNHEKVNDAVEQLQEHISSGAPDERESKEYSPGHLMDGGYYIASQAER